MLTDKIMNSAVGLYQDYTIVFWVIAALLAVVACRKPKESFKFAVFLLVVFCALYAVGLFGESIETGRLNKTEAIHKTKKQMD